MIELLKRLMGWPNTLPARWKYNTAPRAARHWHNPADPVQAARIEAAAAKRERKARKLSHNTWMSRDENLAHDSHRRCRALDPFHVAH